MRTKAKAFASKSISLGNGGCPPLFFYGKRVWKRVGRLVFLFTIPIKYVKILGMENAEIIYSLLNEMHKRPECELDFATPYQLLVSVILSAQCTDKRVNEVTPALFAVAPTPSAVIALGEERLEEYIHSCGFYHNKAKNIIGASQAIISKFGGEVPRTVEELVTLDGVGRKTANVVYAVAFGGNAIAVDTHVFRVSHRLGLSDAKDPSGVERDLCKGFPEEEWSVLHHLLIHHGRYVCKARNPLCGECLLNEYCRYGKED